MLPALSHIESWIFDLDNTLYPASSNLFELIDARMGEFIMTRLGVDAQQAHAIQKGYFKAHGTTLSGMMADEGVDPHAFLAFVHDIDMTRLTPDPDLPEAIAALPGRKFIFTNGDAPYANRVLGALGLGESFDGMFDIHDAGYRPKPDPACYDLMCERLAVDPRAALFVEDMARNLKPAKAIGMTTVWVNNGSDQADHAACASYIDYEIPCVSAWLAGLMEPA